MRRSLRSWNMACTNLFVKTTNFGTFWLNLKTSRQSNRTESTKRHIYTLRSFIWNQHLMSRPLRFEDMTCTNLSLLKNAEFWDILVNLTTSGQWNRTQSTNTHLYTFRTFIRPQFKIGAYRLGVSVPPSVSHRFLYRPYLLNGKA